MAAGEYAVLIYNIMISANNYSLANSQHSVDMDYFNTAVHKVESAWKTLHTYTMHKS